MKSDVAVTALKPGHMGASHVKCAFWSFVPRNASLFSLAVHLGCQVLYPGGEVECKGYDS